MTRELILHPNNDIEVLPNLEDLHKLQINDTSGYVARKADRENDLIYSLHRLPHENVYMWFCISSVSAWTSIGGIKKFSFISDAIKHALKNGYTVLQVNFSDFRTLTNSFNSFDRKSK